MPAGASPRKPFKAWFDAELVETSARRFEAVEPDFDGACFRARALEGLEAHEMMGRVGQIADALRAALPGPAPRGMDALVRALPPLAGGEPDPEGITGSGYLLWPWGEALARWREEVGDSEEEADAAFRAMVALTRHFTAEFAVRPWLAKDPDAWLDRLEPLVEDPSEHVRRWVSEGTRTRLPWGKRVPALETAARTRRRLRILERMHRDPSAYVRRSVANHLQDILKDDREAALPTLAHWVRSGNAKARSVARHAARGLLREGDPEVLGLFGFPAGGGGVRLSSLAVSVPRAQVGEEVSFAFVLEAPDSLEGPVRLRLDLRMEHPGAGARRREKTFRVGEMEVAPGSRVERGFTHAFVDRSIRAVRPGNHRFVARLNGVDAGAVEVEVVAEPRATSTAGPGKGRG
jgi:3-methyladenine DNA glycosylase AlkC